MSSDLELMFNHFLIKRVPPNWEKYGYLSLKPLSSWFKDLVHRIEFFNAWLEKGTLPSYWVSSFYFPQGFMTAVLQTYARKEVIPIDELVFQTRVLDKEPGDLTDIPVDGKCGPNTGVNIHGMYLEGCSWNRRDQSLAESEKKKLFQLMPSIYILPVKSGKYDPKGTYPCPVYKTSQRRGELMTTGHSTNFVLFLDLPSQASTDHWIRRGVALLLQTDD
jgi:dynein heavy chain